MLKYLPVFVCLASTPWLLVGNGAALGRASASLVALIAATFFVLGGAAFTVQSLGAPFSDSFLGRGLTMLVLVPAYLVGSRPYSRARVVAWLWPTGLLLSIAIVLGLMVWQILSIQFVDRPHIYHEEIFLPVAAAVALSMTHGLIPPLRWVMISALLAAGVVSMKNTGFLATGLAASWLTLVTWRSGKARGVEKAARNSALVFMLTIIAVSAAGLALRSPEALPDGTPELRLVSYPTRLLEFMESPVYGQLFVGSPFMELGDRLVQSHSDVLDVLAFGGLMGALLLVLPLTILLFRLPLLLERLRSTSRPAEGFILALTPFILLEALVNPVWHQPSIMILLWISVGFMITSPAVVHASGDDSTIRPAGNALR